MPLDELLEARHVRIGYLSDVYGDITLDDADGDSGDTPRFSGPYPERVSALWDSLQHSPLYAGLTPPQALARMCWRMRTPTWAREVNDA